MEEEGQPPLHLAELQGGVLIYGVLAIIWPLSRYKVTRYLVGLVK